MNQVELRSESVAVTPSVTQISSLVQLAIEKGVPVDVLEQLVALQERVTDRNARGAYFEALANFQDDCPEIPKTKKVNFVTRKGGTVNYSYAPLDAIARIIRPHLKMNGLSYSWNVHTDGNKVLNISCVLRHIEGHSEHSVFPVPIETDGKMSDAQANGAALTYGKRQSLLAVLGLTTADTDIDGLEIGGGVEKVTAEQAANISDLIDASGLTRERFLKWMNVESIADIPAEYYQRAVDELTKGAGK